MEFLWGYKRFFLIFIFLLSGCGNADHNQVDVFIEKVKSAPKKKIEPLPVVEEYSVASYEVSERPNPFVAAKKNKREIIISDIMPDFDRPAEPLEDFPLESLKMVGTLNVSGVMHGVIRAPNGMIYRVEKGNYAGTNYGEIILIDENQIEVNEIVPDNRGEWQRRHSVIVFGD